MAEPPGTTLRPDCGASTPRHCASTRARPACSLAGTEQGIFRSEDGGSSWKLAGRRWLAGAAHRAIAARSLLLAGVYGRRRTVRLHRLRRFLREQRESGRWPQSLRHQLRPGRRPAASRWPDGASAWRSATIAGRPGSCATPACPPPTSGAWPSTRRTPAASTPGVHETAVYVSDDAGLSWRQDGLAGSSIFRMKFVPEAKTK